MLWTRQSPDEISVPGRLQLMVAVGMRACRRLSWADPEEPDKSLLETVLNWAKVVSAKMPQLRLSVLTPVFFSYNI